MNTETRREKIQQGILTKDFFHRQLCTTTKDNIEDIEKYILKALPSPVYIWFHFTKYLIYSIYCTKYISIKSLWNIYHIYLSARYLQNIYHIYFLLRTDIRLHVPTRLLSWKKLDLYEISTIYISTRSFTTSGSISQRDYHHRRNSDVYKISTIYISTGSFTTSGSIFQQDYHHRTKRQRVKTDLNIFNKKNGSKLKRTNFNVYIVNIMITSVWSSILYALFTYFKISVSIPIFLV